MPTPNYATVINQINTFIVANGNNEITANILNPILKLLIDFSNNTIGDLSTLTTDESDNIVNAINSLKENINNIGSDGVKLFTGFDNPNLVPPPSFSFADFYMQLSNLDNSPIELFQYNGFEWVLQNEIDINDKLDKGGYTGDAQDIVDLIDNLPTGLQINDSTPSLTEVYSSQKVEDEFATKADLINGVIPANQLPSYVDDVLEGTYINPTTFNDPLNIAYVAENGKVYVDTTSNITYRWSGSAYVAIGSSLALGETAQTAYRGDRGKTAFEHSQIINANPHNTTASQVGAYTTQQVDQLLDLTTQTITTGGNYNNLEITGDIVIFTNENAQAIINGVWGKKRFRIINKSNTYDLAINGSSSSILGNGKVILAPTNVALVKGKGTANLELTSATEYTLVDVTFSKYRPEHSGLIEKEVMTVNTNAEGETMGMQELFAYRPAQVTQMTKAELNAAYPLAQTPFYVICNQINTHYFKIDNTLNDWDKITTTNVV
jgi:hypothetical protein